MPIFPSRFTLCSSKMKLEDASNRPVDNCEYSETSRKIFSIKKTSPSNQTNRFTISAVIASSLLFISINAILRSFSKNLNRFIVPNCENILRMSSSLISFLKRSSKRPNWLFFLLSTKIELTEYSINEELNSAGKYCCNFSSPAFWNDATVNSWSLSSDPCPRNILVFR